ncbi:MAG: hypothetical protein AAGN35_22365 [Bacteroidota bacterium]
MIKTSTHRSRLTISVLVLLLTAVRADPRPPTGFQQKLNAILQGPIAQGQFETALRQLSQLRRTTTAVYYIDGLRGYCECELGNPSGRNLLQYAIANTQDDEFRTRLREALRICDHSTTGLLAVNGGRSRLRVTNTNERTLRSGGKGFDPSGSGEEVEETYVIDRVSFDQLEARLIADIGVPEATLRVREWLGITDPSGLRIRRSAHFIIVGNRNYSVTDLDRACQKMETSLAFHARQYGLQAPPFLIWIYPQRSRGEMQRTAAQLHGLALGGSNIGYSVLEDLSITAVDPQLGMYTFNHELLHLLLNYNAPFLPPWIGEGLPALYESARPRAQFALYPERNWRSVLLQKYLAAGVRPPTLRALLGMNWTEFDGYGDAAGAATPPRRPPVDRPATKGRARPIIEQVPDRRSLDGGRRPDLNVDEDRTVVRGRSVETARGTIDGQRQLLQHAMAREFLRYLAYRNELQPVIRDQIRVYTGRSSDPILRSSAEVLERTLGRRIEGMERDFFNFVARP